MNKQIVLGKFPIIKDFNCKMVNKLNQYYKNIDYGISCNLKNCGPILEVEAINSITTIKRIIHDKDPLDTR
jgi:hypothetical protein